MSANGVVQRLRYDGFGDLVWSGSPTCTVEPCPVLTAETTIRRNPGKEADEVFTVATATTGRPSTEVGVDRLLRAVRSEATAFDGTMAPAWITYDPIHVGRVQRVLRLSTAGSSSLLDLVSWSSEVDALGRVIEVRSPQGGTTRVSYSGRRQTVLGPTGQARTLIHDELGHVVRATTLIGVSTLPPLPGVPGGTSLEESVSTYAYGAFGDLLHVQDQAGNASDFTYDRLGRRVLSVDPDFGATRTDFDAFGSVVRTVDAEGRTTTLSVDALGRPVARKSPDGLACFSWDGSPQGIGQLAADRFVPATEGVPTVTNAYLYDGLGRRIRSTQSVDGKPWTQEVTFDTFGQAELLWYPNGAAARLWYTAAGYLRQLDDGSGKMLWQEGKQNLLGQSEFEGFGDGYVTTRTYEKANRLPAEVITYRIFQTGELEHFKYKWNADGSLHQQQDLADPERALPETYEYDRANRLVRWSGSKFDASYSYDLTNNLLKKTATFGAAPAKVTSFTPRPAGGPQPHGLTSSSDGAYEYDKTGNVVSAPDQKVEWTAFHLPKAVTTGPVTTTYAYDAHGQRVLERQGNTTVRHFGGLYEEREEEGKPATKVVSYSNGNGVVAQATDGTLRFFHQDHLGSVHVVTDASGALVERRRYEPFGRLVENADPTSPRTDAPSVGFTGHDHDAAHGLVNMGGRVYDPRTGRFLSPDPVVGDPYSGLGLNRFAYVGNDPVNHTDPTGFCMDEPGCGGSPPPPAGGGDFAGNHMGTNPPQNGVDPDAGKAAGSGKGGGASYPLPPKAAPPAAPKVAPTAANSGTSQGPSPKPGASLMPGGGSDGGGCAECDAYAKSWTRSFIVNGNRWAKNVLLATLWAEAALVTAGAAAEAGGVAATGTVTDVAVAAGRTIASSASITARAVGGALRGAGSAIAGGATKAGNWLLDRAKGLFDQSPPTPDAAALRSRLMETLVLRARQLALSWDPAVGELRMREGQAAARIEQWLGRQIVRDASGQADYVDRVLGTISLKGPVPPQYFEGLLESIVKGQSNTAARTMVVDGTGLTAQQLQRLTTFVNTMNTRIPTFVIYQE